MRFPSFLSGGFTTMAVINPPERKLAKRSVQKFVIELAGRSITNFLSVTQFCIILFRSV